MRVKAIISYDGSSYFGLQKQKHTPKTISGTIERVLSSLGIDCVIVASGRTDAKVHATGQVIHFDIPIFWNDLNRLKININRKLDDIYFKKIVKVDDDFHARFGAKRRVYRYIFKTSTISVFEKKYISKYPKFNKDILVEALSYFEGKHNFKNFHKQGSDVHTTIRTIFKTNYINKNGYHIIYFEANGFLRSQVRMMVDMAMSCALNKLSISQLKEQLTLHIKHSSHLAPPEGLYLARIIY